MSGLVEAHKKEGEGQANSNVSEKEDAVYLPKLQLKQIASSVKAAENAHKYWERRKMKRVRRNTVHPIHANSWVKLFRTIFIWLLTREEKVRTEKKGTLGEEGEWHWL